MNLSSVRFSGVFTFSRFPSFQRENLEKQLYIFKGVRNYALQEQEDTITLKVQNQADKAAANAIFDMVDLSTLSFRKNTPEEDKNITNPHLPAGYELR